MDDCPSCFENTKLFDKQPQCKSCEFYRSCAYCVKNPGSKCETRLGMVSYDEFSYNSEVATPPANHEKRHDRTRPVYSLDDMQHLLEFFLRIDDYSLAIVLSVLNDNMMNASQAARVFKVSRQAIHRKLVDSCAKHPELAGLLRANLYRCKRLSEITQEDKNLQPTDNQMEFEF